MDETCPHCGSDRVRRGGAAVWTVYVVLVLVAIPAVQLFHLNAALVAGVMLAVIVIAHLVFEQRVCLDCGAQWRKGAKER